MISRGSPANMAKSPCILSVSISSGLSLERRKVEVISTVMKKPTAVERTSTGIISAASSEGITP